ncbi:MAG: hypothetical protein Q8908_10835 [Bacteroidota bacterium]|nr:hypothetical protein [Bacteroidota bacterium]
MKTLIKSYHVLALLLMTSGLLFLQSCVIYTQPRESMVKVPDIIQMSKDGVSSKDIISKIKRSHTGYNLKADQLAKLQKQGVSDSVINYMEQTHINSAIRNAQYDAYNYWWPGYGGFYYGYPYFGWPYSYGGYWGPTIILRGGVHYGGHVGGHYR